MKHRFSKQELTLLIAAVKDAKQGVGESGYVLTDIFGEDAHAEFAAYRELEEKLASEALYTGFYRFEKGKEGLRKDAEAGGWESAEQLQQEAMLSDVEVEDMYFLTSQESTEEKDVSAMSETLINSRTNVGRRWYDVQARGYRESDTVVWVDAIEFENRFC